MKRTVGIPHRPFFLYPFLRKREVKTMKYRIITLIGLAGSTLAVCFGGWASGIEGFFVLIWIAFDFRHHVCDSFNPPKDNTTLWAEIHMNPDKHMHKHQY